MAPPNWEQTAKKIKTEIEWILQSRQEVTELLSPKAVPYGPRPNIAIDFPGFFSWLTDFFPDDIPHLVHNLKQRGNYTLKHEIAKYRLKKQRYERRVGDSLDAIFSRLTGKAVCREIAAASKHTVLISPYLPDDEDDYNASASADDYEAATSVGMPLMDNKGKPTGGSGTGKGSDSTINFSPSMWGIFSDGRSGNSKPDGPASRPDEVLFHELVHACRELRGVLYRSGVNGGFDNEEEYLAVVIDNIYLSEKGQTQLRASHYGHTILKDPDKFLDANIDLKPRMLLERLRLSQGTLFDSLAHIGPDMLRPAKFNPIWQYNEELRQGKKPPR